MKFYDVGQDLISEKARPTIIALETDLISGLTRVKKIYFGLEGKSKVKVRIDAHELQHNACAMAGFGLR